MNDVTKGALVATLQILSQLMPAERTVLLAELLHRVCPECGGPHVAWSCVPVGPTAASSNAAPLVESAGEYVGPQGTSEGAVEAPVLAEESDEIALFRELEKGGG